MESHQGFSLSFASGKPSLTLDQLLQLTGMGLTDRHAALLLHLAGIAVQLRGKWLAVVTATELEQDLSSLGRGWGRKAIETRLSELDSVGLVNRSKRGQYEIPAHVMGRSEPARGPIREQEYPETDQSFSQAGPQSPNMDITTDDSELDVHAHAVTRFPQEVHSAAWAAACKAGIRGKALDAVAGDPLRGLCWLAHARSLAASDPSVNVGGYVNRMMLLPREKSGPPWPPGTGNGTLVSLTLVDGEPSVTTADGAPWEPARGGAPRVADIAAVEASMLQGPGGQRWDDDDSFARAVRARTEELVALGFLPLYAKTQAQLERLQEHGVMREYTPPARWGQNRQAF